MDTNILLTVSVVMVGVILFSVNYTAISDFYAFSVPLNGFVVEQMVYSSDPDVFQRVKQQQDSTCFVAPSNNEYCYEYPRAGDGHRVTYISGSNGIDGEMHIEPASRATGYWTMSKIAPISETAAVITFSNSTDLNHDGTFSGRHMDEEFGFAKTVERYDTFVAQCRNDGKVLDIVQYLGVVTVDGIEYVATWHVHAISEQGMPCRHSEIIQRSFGHDFGI